MAKSSYLKSEQRKETLENAVSNAYSEIAQLAEEMSSWREGLEEKLSHTTKYEQVGEAADLLESHQDEPYIPEGIGNSEVIFAETVNKNKKRSVSRATRLDNAISRLNACVELLQEKIDDDETNEEIRSDLEVLRDALQDTIDNLDGAVEFPGMFG